MKQSRILWWNAAKQRWSKQIAGRRYTFGPTNGSYEQALADYLARFGGRPTDIRSLQREIEQGATVSWLLNEWANRQLARSKAGEIQAATWRDYQNIATDIADAIGDVAIHALDGGVLRRLDDHYAERVGPQRRRKLVGMFRRVLHWGRVERCLDIPQVGSWSGPSRAVIRRAKAEADATRNLTAAAIHDMWTIAPTWLEAALLLGINAGYSNSDIGHLRLRHFRRVGTVKYLDYPRPKTSIERVSPLWPETIDAIEAWLKDRPAALRPEWEDLVFLTARGTPVDGNFLDGDRPVQTTSLAQSWRKCTRRCGREDIGGFRRLRPTFATVAHGAKDPVAVDYLMGHASKEMRNVYVGSAEWARLTAVTDHVRAWYDRREDVETRGPRPEDGSVEVQVGW